MIVIAGPCVIESKEICLQIAKELKRICLKYGIDYYFKASFDKANRTSINSFRGPGIEKGLQILKEIKEEVGVKVCTDIHESWQAEQAARVCDILQIPAFLCRQTDLLIAAAKTGKTVNVKKAQFLAAWDMENVVGKLQEAGAKEIMLCERGTCFGYNNLIVDMTGIIEMKKIGCPIVFDGTHSVQKPGGKGSSTGGNREYVEYLCKAAICCGADHLFLEVHPDPDNALSDGPNMVRLDEFEKMIKRILKIKEACDYEL